ncbi:MAG: chloride channel protein [Desulfobacterales bacterium]|nr:chloride channel protein [Desulfobacterales bacterium]
MLNRNKLSILDSFNKDYHTYYVGNQAVLILLSILIGVLGAYGAIGFRYLIKFFHVFFFASDVYSFDVLNALHHWQRILYPVAGGLTVGIIVTKFAPEVKGSGIPEVIEAVALKGGIIRFRVLITKAFAAAITIGSGGSAGREGPIVHIGSAIASAIGQYIGASARHMRTFVACGAAASIAATFNAPIAGALFAIEVIMAEIREMNMPPIIISAVIATVISRHHLGDFPAFHVPAYNIVNYKEFLLYAILGLFSGLISVVFIKIFLLSGKIFDKIKIYEWIKPACGGLGVGLIALYLPHVLGVGYETINFTLWNKIDLNILIFILFAKMIATCLSLGSGGSGGIFAPSLFMGATLGSLCGQLANYLFPVWTASSGAYALVGMGAVVAGVTHAPISAILIIFELTNNYLVITPLMLACVISFLISYLLCRKSIYIAKLASKGIKINRNKEINLLRSIKVKSIMEKDIACVKDNTKFSELFQILISGKRPYVIVVGKDNKYIGTVELNDIREVLPQSEGLSSLIIASDIASMDPFVLQNDNLDLVMHLFGKFNKDEVVVCENTENRKVIGILTKNALINAYNIRIFQEDLAGGFCSVMQTEHKFRTIELMGGIHIGEIEVSSSWIGKTLKEADLRRKYEIEVVLIHRNIKGPENRPGLFPFPDMKLEAGDKLLVIGNPQSIKRANG